MSAAAPAAPPPPRAPRRVWPRVLAAVVATVVVVVVLAAAAGYWLLATPGGAQFLGGRVAGMLGQGARIEGIQGRLGGMLRIHAIEIDRPDLFVHVDDVELDSAPLDAFHGTLDVRHLAARNVEIRTASSQAAARAPESFKPPYPVRLEDGRVGTLRIGTITPEEKAARDPAAKRAAREAARAKDVVLHDVVLKGAGDDRAWKIDEASVASELGTARVNGTLGNASPFAVDLHGDFAGRLEKRAVRVAATVGGTLQRLEARAEGDLEGTKATVRATVEPFSSVPVKALRLDAAALDLAHVKPGLPATRLDVHADLAPAGNGFAGPVVVRNAAPGAWDKSALPFVSADARVAVDADGKAEVSALRVALLGGGSATGRVQASKAGIAAELQLASVDLAALHGKLQKTQVSGKVSIAGDAGAQRFDVALKDPRFDVAGRGTLAAERLAIETVTVRTGGGSVTAKGGAALAGDRAFAFEGRAQHFDPSAFVKTAAADLNFAFTAKGVLAPELSGEAHVELAPSRYAGLPASGRIVVAGDAARVARSDVHLTLGEARIDATGSLGRAGDAMDVSLHAPDLSVLARPFGAALAGRMDAKARLTGRFEALAGSVSATGANLSLPGNVHLADAKLDAEAGAAAASPFQATLTAHGIALGTDVPPSTFAQSLDASIRGTRASHTFTADAQMTKESRLQVALAGGLDPRARTPAWNGRVESVTLTGPGAFSLAAPATLAASAQLLELGDARLRGDWGEARFMVTRWTPRTLDVRGTAPAVQVRTLARSLRLREPALSDLVVAADWDLHASETFEGTASLRRISGDVRVGEPALPLGLKDLLLKLDIARGRARADLEISGARIGRVRGDGSATLARGNQGWSLAPNAPVAGRVTADIPDVAAFVAWMGPDAKAAGRLQANVTVSGTGESPRLAGDVRAQDLALREPQTGFEIEHGEVAVKLDGHSVAIERLAAQAPWHPPEGAVRKISGASGHAPGTIEASGAMDLSSGVGNIRIRLAGVPATQLPSRFVALSGEARLESTKEGIVAAGDLAADAGWIGALETPPPSVSEDVVVVRAAQPAPAAPSPAARKERITVDAHFALGNRLYFEGRGLDTRLAGDLRVTGEPAALRASGTVRTVGGTYDGYGQKLAIERGVLHFAGPIDNPQLNVRAIRKDLPVEAGVEVMGSVSHLRVRLVSAPDVPEPEKLSWLVLGRGPSDLGPGDASVLVSAASSMFGKNPGQDFAQKLGFDEVKIGRSGANSVLGVLPQSTVAGRTGTASAAEVVTVGKKLTRDVHLTYEQGLSDAEGSLKVAWQITRRFQLLARAGYLPGLDAVYRWTFR
jgi:translocation and assembly module TamB